MKFVFTCQHVKYSFLFLFQVILHFSLLTFSCFHFACLREAAKRALEHFRTNHAKEKDIRNVAKVQCLFYKDLTNDESKYLSISKNRISQTTARTAPLLDTLKLCHNLLWKECLNQKKKKVPGFENTPDVYDDFCEVENGINVSKKVKGDWGKECLRMIAAGGKTATNFDSIKAFCHWKRSSFNLLIQILEKVGKNLFFLLPHGCFGFFDSTLTCIPFL